jgi:uncharacterized RDD family membrane protein YckC/Tfp pilus assembly major pilin PilA
MFCNHCGARVDTGQQSCGNCGKLVSDAPAAGNSTPPYAGFWKRAGAWILDYVILVLIMGLLAVLLSPIVRKTPLIGLLIGLGYLLTPWLYYALSESSSTQATLGKSALGIRVTDLAGERVSFGRATGRYFGKIISAITMSIGFAMAGFTNKRQALHDKIADTLVVSKDFTPAEIAAAPAAPPASFLAVLGLVLLVILFGPFGIGILAAIAIPAYQDYTIRAQVAEGLTNAAPAKLAIAEAVADGGDPTQLQDDELFAIQSRYVAAMDNRDGVLVITFGGQAHKSIANLSIELVPGIDDRFAMLL